MENTYAIKIIRYMNNNSGKYLLNRPIQCFVKNSCFQRCELNKKVLILLMRNSFKNLFFFPDQ